METEFGYNPRAIETTETKRERLENAGRMFDEIFHVQAGEKVLFITDNDPVTTDRPLITALQESLQRKGSVYYSR